MATSQEVTQAIEELEDIWHLEKSKGPLSSRWSSSYLVLGIIKEQGEYGDHIADHDDDDRQNQNIIFESSKSLLRDFLLSM